MNIWFNYGLKIVKISWNLVEYLRMNPFGTICRLIDAPSWTIPILWRWLESSWSSLLAVAEHQDSRGSLLRLLRTCVDLLEVWISLEVLGAKGLRLCRQPQFDQQSQNSALAGQHTSSQTSCKMILVTVAANKMEQRFVPETSLQMFLKPSRRSPFSSHSRPIFSCCFCLSGHLCRLQDGSTVLVNRGHLPSYRLDRATRKEVPTPWTQDLKLPKDTREDDAKEKHRFAAESIPSKIVSPFQILE